MQHPRQLRRREIAGDAPGPSAVERRVRLLPLNRYLVAILAVLVLIPPGFPLFELFHQRFPLQYFLLAVAFAAWNGGLGPGLLATALGVVVGQFVFLPGRGQGLPTDAFDVARVLITSAVGAMISMLSEITNRRGERLKAALAVKDQFLANMSHEIRTPLGVVVGFAEILRSHEMAKAEQQMIVDTILRNGAALTKIVDDLLALTKVEAGQLVAVSDKVALRPLLEALHGRFMLEAARKGLDLRLVMGVGVPEAVTTDPVCLEKAVTILLSNALKFTEQGAVTLAADKVVSDGRAQVEIRVRDTGIGIDPAHQARLFEAFSQGDASTTRRYGGTGLGLALARHYARAAGGDLLLERSHVGQGSTFLLRLPAG